MSLLSCSSGYESDVESNSLDAAARKQYMASKNIPEVNQDCLWMEEVTVVVKRGRRGYGFTVLGSSPVKVGRVEDGSPGAVAGLQKDDCIIRINGQNVSRSMADSVAKIVKQSDKQIIVDIYRPSNSPSDLCRPSEVMTSTQQLPRKPLQPINEYDEYTQQPITAKDRRLVGKGEPLREVLSLQDLCRESSIDVERRRMTSLGPLTAVAFQELSPQEVERQDSIQKLLRLTEDYVKQMLFGIQRYSRPLRHCIVSPAEHRTLFQNIEKLVELSDNLVQQLSESSTAYTDRLDSAGRYINQFGGVCQNNVSLMAGSYEAYCTGIKSSFRLLIELKAVPEFEEFTHNAILESGQLTIAGFITRPLEYVKDLILVLQQILVKTPLVHHDYQDLADVVDTFRTACKNINENNKRRSQSTLSLVSSSHTSRSQHESRSLHSSRSQYDSRSQHNSRSQHDSRSQHQSRSQHVSGSQDMSRSSSRSDYSSHSDISHGSDQSASSMHSSQSGASSDSSQSGRTSMSHVTACSQSSVSISSVDVDVLDLQRRLVYGGDITFQLATPSRHMIYSGYLNLVDGAGESTLWVVMMSDLLLLTKVTDDEYLSVQEDPILLHNVISVEQSRVNACEFSLLVDCRDPHITNCPYNASRLIALRAPSDKHKCTWTNILEQRISSCKVQREEMAQQVDSFV